jgi:asparagine synthase (glutamine-hydrolysing)
MCGISGEIRFDGRPADACAVAAMADAMAQRGPDGQGLWRSGCAVLGHRRLSIIDLSEAASQPMVDDDLQLALVFNGCIYNHHQLRDRLRRAGHGFRTTSDTEVVIKAYAEWGEEFVDHLVGMFAFALVELRTGRVVLVRDRLGIKPLYVSQTSDRLRFASSLPAVLAGGDIDTSLDRVALHHYLSWHSIVPAPFTLLNGVRKLPPATMRVVEADGRSRDRVYWSPPYVREQNVSSSEEWRERLLDALRTAVERRMVADVPVGVLLSGGVDSSLIVALLAESGVADLRTFSIGFESDGDRAGDEFVWSDRVAERFGTEHSRIRIPTAELPDAVVPAVGAMSEPMASHDVVAFYLLSQRVAEQVKVVQSGQGADEVFAGYSYYQPLIDVPREQAAAAFLREFVDVDRDEMMRCIAPEFRLDEDVSADLVEQACAQPGAETALDAVLRLELNALMPDDPVKRVDNMTMAWGVEARVPFLDHDLVELAALTPPELKLAQDGKGILKDIARPLLPEGVVDRPKGYFPVPGVSKLEGPLLDHVLTVLRSPEAKQRGLIEPGAVDELLTDPTRRFRAGKRDRLWELGVLEMWLQQNDIT